MPHLTFRLIVSSLLISLFSGCGGGGGGASNTLNDSPNAAVASQVADITPDNTQDTVSVFVALDSSNTVTGAALFQSADEQRMAAQANFIQALQTHATGTLQAASGDTCTSADLATRINQAHTPESGNVVRIDLNACELNLLPKLKGVASVYSDIPLSTQTITNTTLTNTNNAVKLSFDGVTTQPNLNGHTADGAGQVIALMDSGVEERHPALGSAKVLNGVCFSTPSNGGQGFCPNGQNTDITSTTAGRSCADTWKGTRAEALQAGCAHGTGMAAAASMNYNVGGVTAKGIAPNAKILPVQVFNETITSTGKSLSASAGDLLAGIEWVAREAQRRRAAGLEPIVAMNMSLGGGSYTNACDNDYVGGLFKTAFAKLRTQGVLPVVATGNGGTPNAIAFPACVSNTLSVSAAKLGYVGLAGYANFNSQTKLIAIGGDVDGTGRYMVPVLCTTAGSYDCWQEVAGTSPATAFASGGVATLYSVKTGASMSDVETALTTDIAALNLAGSSAMHLTVYDGSQNLTRPALRLTASAYKLLGAVESSGSSTNTSNNNTSPAISQAKICIFGKPDYLGAQACATQAYGTNASSETKDLFYRFAGKVGSIRITNVQTNTPLAANTARVTIYTALSTTSQSGSVDVSTADTTRLTIFNNPTIWMIRIQTQ